jgi:hypothetical protein
MFFWRYQMMDAREGGVGIRGGRHTRVCHRRGRRRLGEQQRHVTIPDIAIGWRADDYDCQQRGQPKEHHRTAWQLVALARAR